MILRKVCYLGSDVKFHDLPSVDSYRKLYFSLDVKVIHLMNGLREIFKGKTSLKAAKQAKSNLFYVIEVSSY